MSDTPDFEKEANSFMDILTGMGFNDCFHKNIREIYIINMQENWNKAQIAIIREYKNEIHT